MGHLAGPAVFGRLVQAKILPIFLYGVAVAAPTGSTYLCELEKLLRFAARLTLNYYQLSYFDLLYRLQWKNVARTCFERGAMLAFKYIHLMRHLPGECLRMAIHTGRFSERNLHRNAHDLQLCIPFYSKKICDQFPIFQIFRVWNSLPDSAANCNNLQLFKASIQSPILFSVVQSRIPDTVVLIDSL